MTSHSNRDRSVPDTSIVTFSAIISPKKYGNTPFLNKDELFKMRSLLVWFLHLHYFFTAAQVDSSASVVGCPCLFNGDDQEDCVVWGSLDGELHPWSKADQACLDAYEIKIDAEDPSIMCSSTNSFVNGLKNLPSSLSTVKFGLGIPYGGFWEESSTNPDIPVLKATITIDSTTYDCESSESDCYNAMKPYFESDADGMQEMDDVCEQLENEQRNARELEQSTLRVRICQEDREGATIVSECSTMFADMESDLQTFSTMNCGGFGTGIGSQVPPECEESISENESSAPIHNAKLRLSALSAAAFTGVISLERLWQ